VGISGSPRQITVDEDKVRRMLGTAELAWLVERIRSRLERGEPVDGTVTLVGASPVQRKAVAALLARHPGRGTSLSVFLPEVAEQLRRAAAAPSLAAAVEAIGGPVRDLAAERAADLQRWGDALGGVRSSWLAHLSWYRQWLDAIGRDGTVTRLIRQGHAQLISQATAVLERLPRDSDDETATLSALAADATGDERALDDGPLAGLVLRALALREGVQPPASKSAEQELWSAARVVADELASQVLVLNVRAGGEPVGRWLTEAAEAGQPFRLTLRQLLVSPVMPWALEIYVCSSTTVLRAAADTLGARSPALVCTEGEPSVACTRLLQAAASSGSSVYWHGGFTWPGVRSTAIAVRHLQAQPWLMAASDYQAAIADGARALTGPAEPSPWDPRLNEMMRSTGRGVGEQRTAATLLAALTARADVLNPRF
jgi:uncharacterized protein (TIGR02679 family)